MFENLEPLTGIVISLLLTVWALGIFAAICFVNAAKLQGRVADLQMELEAMRHGRRFRLLEPDGMTHQAGQDVKLGRPVCFDSLGLIVSCDQPADQN